jgi:uncharacterized phage protein (TIGR01671 family)
MREILFRGKRCDNGEWVQGFYVRADHHWHKNGIHKDWIALGASANGGWFALHNKYAVKAETVGQFTGLTDKNGKKIFEGDIVRVCLDPEICIGDVIWDNEIASYNIPFNNGKCVLPIDIFIAKNKVGDKVWIEVIGNIHDNPELLENP